MEIIKNYEKPQIKFTAIQKDDIIRTSFSGPINPASMMTTNVNGKDATSYGEQDVSIFD